jgi:hypothetical protein
MLGGLSLALMPRVNAVPDSLEALLEADAARVAAMVAGNDAALEKLFAEDMTYVHSSGVLHNKKQLLDALRSGQLHFDSIVTDEVRARAYGIAGIVTGTAQLQVKSGEKSASLSLRYTATYVHVIGHWQLAAYESTLRPKAL